jgi:hypothetical protein
MGCPSPDGSGILLFFFFSKEKMKDTSGQLEIAP